MMTILRRMMYEVAFQIGFGNFKKGVFRRVMGFDH